MLTFRRTSIIFCAGLIALVIISVITTPMWWWLAGWVVVYIAVISFGATVLSMEYFLPVHYRGAPDSGAIAITFDDGPLPGRTEKILDILKSYEAPAAFFCIGNRVKNNPGLMRKIHASGHLVGNHSYFHAATFDLQSAAAIEKELKDTDNAIHESLGVTPNFFRPPYGVTNPMVAKAVVRRGYKTIGWSLRSFDTITPDPKSLLNRVKKSLRSGDVVLFHDYCESTIEILPAFLDYAKGLGLKIVRVDTLLNEQAYAAAS